MSEIKWMGELREHIDRLGEQLKLADALAKEVKDLSGDFLLMRDAQIAEIVAQRSQLPYFQRGVRYLLEALAAYEKVRNGKYE